jgi:radial spoke head protein 9
MEAADLHLNIDYVGTSGIVLSPEQKAALQTSLVIQQNRYKFNQIYFWGKILGIKDDYFIAQGKQRDEMAESKTLYRYGTVICITNLCFKQVYKEEN